MRAPIRAKIYGVKVVRGKSRAAVAIRPRKKKWPKPMEMMKAAQGIEFGAITLDAMSHSVEADHLMELVVMLRRQAAREEQKL